jgi:hypothetical protein
VLEDGIGGPRDARGALDHLRHACDAEVAPACTALGGHMETGRGMRQDYAEAGRVYAIACRLGDLAGCVNLATLEEEGRGRAVNATTAARLYGHACDGGELTGCSRLGLLMQSGEGVTQDLPQALALLTRACDGGEMRGCNGLAYMNERGLGLPAPDVIRARELYSRASRMQQPGRHRASWGRRQRCRSYPSRAALPACMRRTQWRWVRQPRLDVRGRNGRCAR